MATIQTERTGPLTERIDVTVSREDYLPGFEAALKQYAAKANIPGFRKGMVPTGLIRKMYGPSVFADEVVRTVEKELTAHLRNDGRAIFGQPLPSPDNDLGALDPKAPADYRFSFDIGLKPDFTLADLPSAPLVRYRVDVTEDMVGEEVDRLRRKHGRMTEHETVSDEQNIVHLRFEACDEAGQPAEEAKDRDIPILVHFFNADYRPRLMGLRKDDTLTLRIGEAFDEKEAGRILSELKADKEDPAALLQPYRITLTRISIAELAAMDEELWKQAFPHMELRSEQEFRDQLRAGIQEQFDVQTESHLHHELYYAHLEHTAIELPEAFLRRWLREGQDKPKTEEEAEAELPDFLRQLRWTLITEKIVNDNAISVSREEVMDHMRGEVLGYFGGMGLAQGQFGWIEGYVERMMKDRQQFEGSFRKVQTEKVFRWAAAHANPAEKVVSLEAFRHEQEAHRHEH